MFQVGALKARHDLLLVVLPANQSEIKQLKSSEKGGRCDIRILRGAMHSGKKWRNALWLNAMHSGKSGEFEKSYPLLYTLFKSCLCCCSFATLAPQQ